MAVTSVEETWRGQTWSDSKDGSREYDRVFRVYSDSTTESPVTIRNTAGIPAPWDGFPSDSEAIVVDRSSRRLDGSRFVWEVTVSYAWERPDDDDEDPTLVPPKISWSAAQYNEPVIKDRNGDAIVNSAGDYFDPPPEREAVRWSVSITSQETSVPTAILSYAGAVNSNPFTIDGVSVAAEVARIVGLDIGETEEQNGTEFRTLNIEIEFREEGWDLEVLDQGYRYLDGTVSGEPQQRDILIEDDNGEFARPSAPVLLDGNGQQLEDPSPTTAVFLDFPIHQLLDFSVLPGIS